MSKYITKENFRVFWNNVKNRLLPKTEPMINYVVEANTWIVDEDHVEEKWTYKKWSNGLCEAWAHRIKNNVPVWSGKWYNVNIPIPAGLFIDTPFCIYAQASASGLPGCLVGGCSWTATQWTGYVSANNNGNNNNLMIDLYVVGYWR